LLGVLWLSLPRLLAAVAANQLEQSGFSNVEINIDDVTLSSVTVGRLTMSNVDLDIEVMSILLTYNISRLLSGQLISIEVKNIVVNKLGADVDSNVLPDPALISSMLLTPWQQYNPADFMSLNKLEVYEASGNLILTASAEVSRQGESTQVDISLLDNKGNNHSLVLLLSAESAELQWQSPDSEVKTPVDMKIYANANGQGLAGQADINLTALKGIVPELDNLSGRIQSKFSYVGKNSSDEKELSLSANIVDVAIADSGVKGIKIDVKATLTEDVGSLTLRFEHSSVVKMEGLYQGKNRVKKVNIHFPRQLKLEAGWPQLDNNSGAKIAFSDLVLDNIKIPTIKITDFFRPTRPVTESQDRCGFSVNLNIPLVVIDDVQINATEYKTEVSCPGEGVGYWSITAENDNIDIDSDDLQLSLAECKLTAKSATAINLDEMSGSTSCQNKSSNGALESRFYFNSSKESGHVDYSFSGIKPDSDKPLFRRLMKGWQQPFDIVSGNVSAKGRYQWWKNRKNQDTEKLNVEITVNEVGGFYEGVLFSGLSYKGSIDLLPDIKSSDISSLTVTDIDIGIPVTSARVEILLETSKNGSLPIIRLNGLSMSVLDGKIIGNGLELDINNDTQEMVLVAEGLDLAEIVDMQQIEGLTATGRLDGYIPVTVTDNGIRISKGKIVTQEQGGYIHYKPAGGTSEIEKSAIGSEFVFRIIEDLDYNSLNIDVDYEEDGALKMQLAIKGISPKIDTRRPIHFNLNVQQNVLQLLKGLRYADGLSKGLDDNVQKYFRNEKNTVN